MLSPKIVHLDQVDRDHGRGRLLQLSLSTSGPLYKVGIGKCVSFVDCGVGKFICILF